MPIPTGTRLGPYEIQSLIGAGGMGEVHKARDTRLDRTVAIKVLSDRLPVDSERQERFNREARVISSLNHPNICTLYDVGHENGVDFLVMEYLEGQTLADRIAKGPMPIAEALPIAIEVAEALNKAHRAGITHRDLKPGNVMLTKGGAKLLDFGLARSSPKAAPGNASSIATATANLTVEGKILGTLPYMSPEQVEGAGADERSDIWGLGCLLYEMLTGRQAFGGTSHASLIASIMGSEPPNVASLQSAFPPELDRLVRNCLMKDPNRRWQNAYDVVLELKDIALRKADPVSIATLKGKSRFRTLAVAVLVLLGVGLPALWLGRRTAGVTPNPEVRFEVSLPPGTRFPATVESVPLAVSPDGSTLAFVAIGPDGISRIWTRAASEFAPRPLTGTEGARSITWKPDGKSLAFFTADKLRRLDLPDGSPVTICDVLQGIGFSPSWGESGEILFASVQGTTIFRVQASGGTPEKILEADAAGKDIRNQWPRYIPGGRGFLYLSRSSEEKYMLKWVQPGKPPRDVGPIASRFEFIEPDRLAFVRDGELIAQRIDFNTGQLTGVPLSIAPRIQYFFSSAWAGFSASSRGTVLYLAGENVSRLVWLSRSGKTENEVGKRGDYLDMALSPDGHSALLSLRQPSVGTFDLWHLDLERNVPRKLTSSPDADFGATWLPDGSGFVYSSLRGSPPNLVRRNLTTGEEDVLLPRRAFQQSTDIAQNGRDLAFIERGSEGGFHGWTLQLEGERLPRILFNPESRQEDIRFSPDGKYFAYRSDESGEWEAYVAPLAHPSNKVRISSKGARRLRWRKGGDEILLLTPDKKMVRVPIRTVPDLKIGDPVTLFTLPEGGPWYDFDVTSDGQRFLMVERLQTAESYPASAILNWTPKTRP